MLRAIIIDDEQIGINTLKLLIEKHTEGIRVIATTAQPEQGITLIEDYRPDVVFLDISMPRMNGFEMLEKLNYRDFSLVFTTAHQEHAIKAIKNRAEDYLLKPIDIDDLKICASKLVKDRKSIPTPVDKNYNLIEIPVKDGMLFIRQQEIIRLEASGSYTNIYIENGIKHLVSKNLKECEAMLNAPFFYRCHTSHIINLKKVDRMISTDGLFARMEDGSMPVIALKNKEQFLQRLRSEA